MLHLGRLKMKQDKQLSPENGKIIFSRDMVTLRDQNSSPCDLKKDLDVMLQL